MPRRNLHQSETQPHARLGFHPDCPVCRQDRLFGALCPEPAVGLRVRALLATGVLALSAGLTSTSVAYEPDQQQEGVVLTGPSSPDLSSPGIDDPGSDDVGTSEDTTLTDILASDPPGDGVADDPDADSGPVEANPPDDPADPDQSEDPTGSSPAPAEIDPAPPTAPLAMPQGPPPPAHRTWLVSRSAALQGRMPEPRPRRGTPTRAGEPAPGPTTSTASARASAAGTVPAAPPLHGPTYKVQPGDSLWSIAARLLGPNAAPAAIAHEVHRLWTLNEARIGTGDPNLLAARTILRLR